MLYFFCNSDRRFDRSGDLSKNGFWGDDLNFVSFRSSQTAPLFCLDPFIHHGEDLR